MSDGDGYDSEEHVTEMLKQDTYFRNKFLAFLLYRETIKSFMYLNLVMRFRIIFMDNELVML